MNFSSAEQNLDEPCLSHHRFLWNNFIMHNMANIVSEIVSGEDLYTMESWAVELSVGLKLRTPPVELLKGFCSCNSTHIQYI